MTKDLDIEEWQGIHRRQTSDYLSRPLPDRLCSPVAFTELTGDEIPSPVNPDRFVPPDDQDVDEMPLVRDRNPAPVSRSPYFEWSTPGLTISGTLSLSGTMIVLALGLS